MKHTFSVLLFIMTGMAVYAQKSVKSLESELLRRLELPCCYSQGGFDATNNVPQTAWLGAPKDNKKNEAAKPKSPESGSAIPKVPIYNDKASMIKVSKDKDGYYFEVADSLMGRDILAVTRYTSTPSGLGTYGGEQVSSRTMYFEKNRINNTLMLRVRANYMKADTLDAIYKAVKASSTDPIVAVFKIIDNPGGKENKINVTQFLLGDNILGLGAYQKNIYGIMAQNNDMSYIESIHAYPINTEIRTVRTYTLTPSRHSSTMTFGLNTSFYLLPKEPMRPRIFDPRVGYFNDSYYNYSDNQQQVERTTMVCRRRLEPKNEADAQRQRNGELIEPKQQIVYYIDPATPKQWRPYLIQGVKDWNATFEQAGWKNAITALEWPENDSTMSMEDSRYSVIMYLASNIANAYGPQNHDPRSGEIIECHVGWYHNVMSLVHDWYQIQCGALDPEARNAKFSDELMGQLVRFVSSHEVGHTLGLRHNFGASATVPVDSLRSNSYLAKYGFCPSIMDYARFNYVAQPEDNIEIKNLFPRINDYDKWAIEWGYRPIYEATDAESDRYMLSKITTERTNQDKRLFWYDGEGNSSDPRAQTEDLGDDAAKANSLGIENLKRIIPHLREWNYWGKDNNDDKVVNMYRQLANQYTRYCLHVIKNLSGPNRTPLAPDQEGPVYEYPAKEKALTVVPFLQKQLFTRPSWLVDVPYANRVFADDEEQIENITSVLIRIATSGNIIEDVNPRYGSVQYLSDLTKAIFKGFNTSVALDRYQRFVQSIFVHNLCETYMANRSGTSNDALAAIYCTLNNIEKKIHNVSNADQLTSAHYMQLAVEIQRALVVK